MLRLPCRCGCAGRCPRLRALKLDLGDAVDKLVVLGVELIPFLLSLHALRFDVPFQLDLHRMLSMTSTVLHISLLCLLKRMSMRAQKDPSPLRWATAAVPPAVVSRTRSSSAGCRPRSRRRGSRFPSPYLRGASARRPCCRFLHWPPRRTHWRGSGSPRCLGRPSSSLPGRP